MAFSLPASPAPIRLHHVTFELTRRQRSRFEAAQSLLGVELGREVEPGEAIEVLCERFLARQREGRAPRSQRGRVSNERGSAFRGVNCARVDSAPNVRHLPETTMSSA